MSLTDIASIETEDDPFQALIELDQRLRQYHWWFGEDDLPAEAVERQAEWKEHPFDALEFDQGLTLYRRNQEGQIDHRDAAGLLIAFTCHEAFRLLHLWNAPDVVGEYLRTGNQRLCNQAAEAVRVALDAAYLDLPNTPRLPTIAEPIVPTLP